MCDVVDKVSFAEVDGDLSIGGALLEHPGALLLARARHPHPRHTPVRLLTSHQHQLTSDHNFTQFTFTILTTLQLADLLTCHHSQANLHILK